MELLAMFLCPGDVISFDKVERAIVMEVNLSPEEEMSVVARDLKEDVDYATRVMTLYKRVTLIESALHRIAERGQDTDGLLPLARFLRGK